eukprot:4533673-Amphidinium_carterae.1
MPIWPRPPSNAACQGLCTDSTEVTAKYGSTVCLVALLLNAVSWGARGLQLSRCIEPSYTSQRASDANCDREVPKT